MLSGVLGAEDQAGRSRYDQISGGPCLVPCFLSWSLGTALFLQKHKVRVAEQSPGDKKSGEGVCLKWKFPPKILMVLT